MINLAWHMKSSNSHSLFVWECLVIYILEFKLLWLTIFKTIKCTNLNLVSFKLVGKKTATRYISMQSIKD